MKIHPARLIVFFVALLALGTAISAPSHSQKKVLKKKTDVIRCGNDSLLRMAPKEALKDTVILTDLKDWPQPIKRVPPVYPDFARINGIQASVYMQVLVGKDGRPVTVQVARVTPSYIKLKDTKQRYKPAKSDADLFFKPSVEAVLKWEFTVPKKPNGNAANVWVNLPLEYKLTQ